MSGESSTANTHIALPTSLPIPEGYDEALPPWTLDAEAWWIFPPVPMSWQNKELPKGAIDPFEAERYRDLQATYTGGLGTIQLIRYHTSPVGPYDELLYVPGNMTYKTGPISSISGLSITRIYVSTAASIVNGRRNWSIPKQLARFEFKKEDESDVLSPVVASVYPALTTSSPSSPEFTPDPVFKARLVPSRRLPNFPLNLARVPTMLLDPRLFQAPLTPSGQAGGLVGTEKWCTIAPEFAGEVRVLYPEPGLPDGRFGDGLGFPDVKPMSVGLWWPTAKIVFTPAVILDVHGHEDKKTK
ncbi:hypothetical protein FRC09_014250 [Ceratobasidium sp. 395]|nr:hypothetical protein FRC09_014250 [Ceratobasidium sp. 395]